jgi:hypothetical protein
METIRIRTRLLGTSEASSGGSGLKPDGVARYTASSSSIRSSSASCFASINAATMRSPGIVYGPYPAVCTRYTATPGACGTQYTSTVRVGIVSSATATAKSGCTPAARAVHTPIPLACVTAVALDSAIVES